MAYMKSIFTACTDASGCKKRASKLVCTRQNSQLGQFCAPHAKRALERQQQIEKQNDADIKRNPSLKGVLA